VHELDLEVLVAGVVRGERRAIARALRLVDERPERGRELAHALFPHRRGAQIVGLTGNPGAGKSTVVDALIAHLRKDGKRVGVLAVDPSSPFSGGAILGDRIRMSRHTLDDGVFVRSLATRGALGGLSRATFDSVRVLDAAGFDVVLIETVGVGQDEIDIARLAETTVVVLVPGLGDDVQALKAGLLEVADVFLINKADRPGVPELERSLHQMLALAPPHDGWTPPIAHSVAVRDEGMPALAAELERHRVFLDGAAGRRRREQQASELFSRLLDAALVERGRAALAVRLPDAEARVSRDGVDPYGEVLRLLEARGAETA